MRPEPKNKLDQRIKSVWRISALVGLVISLIVYLIITLTYTFLFQNELNAGAPSPGLIILILVILFIVQLAYDLVISPNIRYARWRYEVTPTEIDFQRGLISKKRTIIPLVRVQHVETTQGPIMRHFKLASVSIATAGKDGSHAIPGLSQEDADALRDKVAVLARIAQEDV